uniref:NADH-ubiquinone oxidoreductase chain 3 n=1 Tax=Capitonius sp. QL-2013 TaxID=1421593 RepID=A0A0A6ZL28_9HYME|nr:NADH dehydrogenase subunit 3 [Capitonius sp. QL-2013]
MLISIILIMMINFIISFILIFLNYLISKKMFLIREKNSSFECGYEPFESSRLPFSIHFYLIGVLFLIFDVEIILLIPIMISLKFVNYYNWLYCSFFILMILFLGLEYEKKEGSLKWLI